jgi:hypothetical protein
VEILIPAVAAEVAVDQMLVEQEVLVPSFFVIPKHHPLLMAFMFLQTQDN